MATKVKEAAGAVERILLPRLNSIDGELKSINARVDSVLTSVGEMDKRINTRIDSVLTSVGEMDKRLTTKIEEMDKRLTTKIGEIDGRLTTKIEEMDKRHSIQFESIRNEIRGLSEKVDLVRDVEKLKVKVAELKRRR